MPTEEYRIEVSGGQCRLRLNDWDARAFGFKVTEILELEAGSSELISAINERALSLGSSLTICRHSASDIATKGQFLSHGYYIAECAMLMSVPAAQARAEFKMEFHPALESQMPEVTALATKEFRYSRFHEDPNIDPALASLRYANWVGDLHDAGKLLVSVNSAGRVIGFISYALGNNNSLDLVLAGVAPEYRGLGALFLQAMVNHVRPFGSPLKAMVSAANHAALNVYLQMGFKVAATYYDYHKLHDKRPR